MRYVYQCKTCDQQIEAVQSFSDEPLITCANCGTDGLKRIPQIPVVRFVGNGWATNDLRQAIKNENV